MGYARPAVTKVELSTKLPGVEGLKTHRQGVKCTYQRHETQPGQYVIMVGKRYAVIDAVRLHDVVATSGGL